MERLISFVGLLVMLAIAWLLSENRRKMNWRLIASGVGAAIVWVKGVTSRSNATLSNHPPRSVDTAQSRLARATRS